MRSRVKLFGLSVRFSATFLACLGALGLFKGSVTKKFSPPKNLVLGPIFSVPQTELF